MNTCLQLRRISIGSAQRLNLRSAAREELELPALPVSEIGKWNNPTTRFPKSALVTIWSWWTAGEALMQSRSLPLARLARSKSPRWIFLMDTKTNLVTSKFARDRAIDSTNQWPRICSLSTGVDSCGDLVVEEGTAFTLKIFPPGLVIYFLQVEEHAVFTEYRLHALQTPFPIVFHSFHPKR